MITSKLSFARSARLTYFAFAWRARDCGSFRRAIHDEHLRLTGPQAESCGPGSTSGAHHQNSFARKVHPLLQRSNDAGDIGIEAVELALRAAYHGIAGADLPGEGIGVRQRL